MNKKNHVDYRIFFLAFLLVSMLLPACNTQTGEHLNRDTEEKLLLERIHAFNLAFKECDIGRLEKLITGNYVHTNGNAKAIDRNTWLAYLEKRRKEINRGELMVISQNMQDVEIQFYGDMAIVTGKITVVSLRSGKEQEDQFRITHIWVKEGQDWIRAGFHDARII